MRKKYSDVEVAEIVKQLNNRKEHGIMANYIAHIHHMKPQYMYEMIRRRYPKIKKQYVHN